MSLERVRVPGPIPSLVNSKFRLTESCLSRILKPPPPLQVYDHFDKQIEVQGGQLREWGRVKDYFNAELQEKFKFKPRVLPASGLLPVRRYNGPRILASMVSPGPKTHTPQTVNRIVDTEEGSRSQTEKRLGPYHLSQLGGPLFKSQHPGSDLIRICSTNGPCTR
jgi:hypothetical protein